MKIEKLEVLKEEIKEIIENECLFEEKKFDFEVESGTDINKSTGGKLFNSFDKALNYAIEQIQEQTDKNIQDCEDFEQENWYQINLFIDDETYNLIGFERANKTEFKAVTDWGEYSNL